MINNTCCINSRLLEVRYRTITTRTIYCTVCTLHQTNPITQYPILCGNSWELSALLILICLQIIYNYLQNLFDKIIVFQIDFYIFNHVIFIPPDQKAGQVYIYIIGNNCHFRQTCSITVSTKIFRLCPQNHHFPKQFPTLSQINTFC